MFNICFINSEVLTYKCLENLEEMCLHYYIYEHS